MVVREHADRVARPELVADLGEVAVGPVVDDLVGHREPLHRREHRARVAHRRRGSRAASRRFASAAVKSTAPKMIMRGGSANDSMKTRDRLLARFAVLAVVPRRREPGLELAERVARDDAVEVGVAERARSAAPSGRTSSLAPRSGPVDRPSRARPAPPRRAQRVAQLVVQAHQSNGSTNRWIVPPHVSPTANASSSE